MTVFDEYGGTRPNIRNNPGIFLMGLWKTERSFSAEI
jgi:hypothetical protein